MRILFAGSPAVALPSLEAVAGVATELAVMSQPDKPVGRQRVLAPTAVSAWALEHSVALYRPVDHDGITQAVVEFTPQLGITVAYGRLLKPEVLKIPDCGWWNLHFSLLPRWRGAAPVQHALLAGETETGVSVFRLDEGMDTGPLLRQRSHSITPGITAGELLSELAQIGAELLAETLRDAPTGHHATTAQQGHPSHAPKLERETGRITSTDTSDMALRRFQGTTPEPGCFVSWNAGKHTVRIYHAREVTDPSSPADGSISLRADGVCIALGGGVLVLGTVQPAGKKAMPAADWWRGVHEDIRIDA